MATQRAGDVLLRNITVDSWIGLFRATLENKNYDDIDILMTQPETRLQYRGAVLALLEMQAHKHGAIRKRYNNWIAMTADDTSVAYNAQMFKTLIYNAGFDEVLPALRQVSASIQQAPMSKKKSLLVMLTDPFTNVNMIHTTKLTRDVFIEKYWVPWIKYLFEEVKLPKQLLYSVKEGSTYLSLLCWAELKIHATTPDYAIEEIFRATEENWRFPLMDYLQTITGTDTLLLLASRTHTACQYLLTRPPAELQQALDAYKAEDYKPSVALRGQFASREAWFDSSQTLVGCIKALHVLKTGTGDFGKDLSATVLKSSRIRSCGICDSPEYTFVALTEHSLCLNCLGVLYQAWEHSQTASDSDLKHKALSASHAVIKDVYLNALKRRVKETA